MIVKVKIAVVRSESLDEMQALTEIEYSKWGRE